MRAVFFRSKIKYSFKHYVEYVLSKAEKSILIDSNNIITGSTDIIHTCMSLMAQLNKRTKYPEVHMALSFTEEEAEQCSMLIIVRNYLKAMGWGKAQYIAVRHSDVPGNPHCHIVLNLIGEDGKRFSDSFCVNRSIKICRKLSKFRDYNPSLKEKIDIAIQDSSDLQELRENLHMEFLDMRKKKDNFEFFEISNRKNRERIAIQEVITKLEIGLISNLNVVNGTDCRKNLKVRGLHN